MSQSGKLMPNLDQNSTKLLNLTVLQRIGPNVEEILITAAHVTFYEFNIDLSQWSRKDVEGSLFVVKRKIQPRFQFIVMNRRNTENLVENVLGDFEYEIQVPYILYRNAAQEVNGIWFYNARECEEVANLFGRIINAYSKGSSKSMIASTKSEFEELKVVPNMAVVDGPLEPSPSNAASTVNNVPDDPAFVNFFSSAINLENRSVRPITGELHKPYPKATLSNLPTSVPPIFPSPQVASTAVSTSATLLSLLDNSESSINSNRTTNLVKPSSFSNLLPASPPLMMPHVSSLIPTAPPLHPPSNLHSPYGTPVLQPFPPPTPPPSLTPTSIATPSYGPVISRERVREALMVLVQDNQFVDMVHRALLNAHHS